MVQHGERPSHLDFSPNFHILRKNTSRISYELSVGDRGQRTVKEVLQIGLEAIYNFDGYDELNEAHME